MLYVFFLVNTTCFEIFDLLATEYQNAFYQTHLLSNFFSFFKSILPIPAISHDL